MCCLYFLFSFNSREYRTSCESWYKRFYIGQVYVHFEAHMVRMIGPNLERLWMKAWLMFYRYFTHADIICRERRSRRTLNPIHFSSGWDLKWFFRAEDRGGGSGVWHGHSVLVQASAPGSTKALLYHQEHTHTHTCMHSFSLTIDSASLIVTIPPPCFSSLWPRASSPLNSLPRSGFPPSSHLSRLLWLNYSWRVVVPNVQCCADTGGFISTGVLGG